MASVLCQSAGSQFGVVSTITRSCSALGVWEPANFSQCSIAVVETDFASIWITVNEDDVNVVRANNTELVQQVITRITKMAHLGGIQELPIGCPLKNLRYMHLY